MATVHLAGEQEQSLNTLGKYIEAIRDLLVQKYTEAYVASTLNQDTWEVFLQS